jgi:hypothetical protein
MKIEYLRIIFYPALRDSNINKRSGLTVNEIAELREHEPEHLKGILEAVRWGVEHPGFDFLSLDPDYRCGNKELHEYLCKVDRSLDVIRTPS